MKITVLNKTEVVLYQPKEDAIIIRIGDVYPLNKIFGKYIDQTHFYFSDIDEESEYSIQDDESDKLASFILKYIDTVDEIVVHCVYAQGRSPAIGYAIATYLGKDNDYINKYPDINLYVYNKLMNSFLKFS